MLGTGSQQCCRIISGEVETSAADGHSPLSWGHQGGAACTSPGLELLCQLRALLGCLAPSSDLSAHFELSAPTKLSFFLFVVTCQQYFSLSILSQVHPRLAVWFGLGQCLVLEEGVRIHILACRGTLLPGPDVTSLLETTLLNLLPLFHCFVTCNILSVFCLMCSGEILNSFLVKISCCKISIIDIDAIVLLG